MSEFGLRLKELRDQKNFTQVELASAAKLTHQAIAKLEQGLRQPTWDTVRSLCNALGVSCEAFNEPPTLTAKGKAAGTSAKDSAKRQSAPRKRNPKPLGASAKWRTLPNKA